MTQSPGEIDSVDLLSFESTEMYDKHAMRWVINNFDSIKHLIRDVCFEDDISPLKRATNIYNALQMDGTLKVKYERAHSRAHGRLYAKGIGGLQNICREMRNTFSHKYYNDIDIVNAHPILLSYLATQHKVRCTALKAYITNRETYLQEIVSNNNISRDDAKNLIIAIINGGTKMYSKLSHIPDWLIDFKNETEILLKELALKYPDELQFRKKLKKGNYYASTVNSIVCEMEHKCVVNAIKFFKLNNHSVDVIVFDGFMVRKNEYNPITPSLLEKVSQYVLEKTGYCINFSVKRMDDGIINLPPDYMLYSINDTIEIIHDAQAVEYALQFFSDYYKKCNDRYFYKTDGIWFEDSTKNLTNLKNSLMYHIMTLNIVKVTNKSKTYYSKNTFGASNISKAFIVNLPNDPTFINKLWSSNLKTLTFKNGVYSFKDNKFYEGGLPNVYTTIVIERNFKKAKPECIQEVYDKLFNTIFMDKHQLDHFLNWIARGLAGEYIDKTWAVMLGMRNSGKGVLVEALTNAFGNYVSVFNAEYWLSRGNSDGDEAKRMSWVLDHEFTRLNFSNEMRLTDDKNKQLTIDGTIPKKVGSGGDYIIARKNFQNEQKTRPQGRFMLLLNDMNNVSPEDAKETCIYYDMKTIFKDEITHEDELINKLGQMRILKGDSTIKGEWLSREDIQDAIAEIVISAYGPILPIPKSMKDEVSEFKQEDSLENKLKELITITGLMCDRVRIPDLVANIKHLNMTNKKLKKVLVSMGAIYDNKHGFYKCIKMKIDG
jgi:hypothetical protein